jgi:PKHD-type hydroxylase
MKAMWSMFPELLSWETCNDICKYGENIKPQDAIIGANREVNTEIRSSIVRWVNYHNEDFKDVFAMIERLFHEANAANFGTDINFLPPLQFTEYRGTANGHYDWHVDVFWESTNMFDRKLSMVIMLSDPNEYEGGDLQFDGVTYYPNPAELRKRGTVIVFPSFVRHRVTPVTSGIRKSLVAWIEGPKWR